MYKSFLIFLALFLIGLIYLFGFDNTLSNRIENINIKISKQYDKIYQTISHIAQRHTEQKKWIIQLQEYTIKLKEQSMLLSRDLEYYKDQVAFGKLDIPDTKDVTLARVVAVQNIYKSSRFWISLDKNITKISGLISNNFAAGIVKLDDNRPLIYLNHDEKANYGVYIGANKAFGITHGQKNSKDIIVKFIPIFSDIKVGDEVATNGLDGIFYAGLKVGKVIQVLNNNQNHKEAIVKPYASSKVSKYYYVY